MKKIFLLVVAFALMFSGVQKTSAKTAEESISDLEQMKSVLLQADKLQKKIIAQDAINSIYKIKVLHPNGGESLKPGDVYQISWDTISAGVSKINIYLATSTDNYASKYPGILLAKEVPAETPYYNWTVTNNISGDYSILIRNSAKTYKVSDYSDATFTVLPVDLKKSAVKIVSPVGGEYFRSGMSYSVKWTMDKGADRFVNIKLVKSDASATSTDFVLSNFEDYITATDGSYEWKIPSWIPSGVYKIKIYGLKNGYTSELESKNIAISERFRIIKSSEIPKGITVLSQNEGADIKLIITQTDNIETKLVPVASTTASGIATTTYQLVTTTTTTYSTSTEKIVWSTPMDLDNVDISLRSIPSGMIFPIKLNTMSLITATTSINELTWTPNKISSPGEKFFMRICRTNSGYCDESDKPFGIMVSTTPQDLIAKPVVDPKTPEYDILRSIIDKIKSLVSGKEEKKPNVIKKIDYTASTTKATYLPHNFETRLSCGMIDSDEVRALQEALKKEGFFKDAITGRFFDVTKKAVQDFQNKYGFEPSGSTGPGTQAKLNEIYGTNESVVNIANEPTKTATTTNSN
ncbi:MAG: Ser-Thr-rich GPI-anchored membrane family protein [bacterium]